MALVITSPGNFVFAFAEPAAGGPDPKQFSASSGFTIDNPASAPVFYFAQLTSVTSNMGNFDWFGGNPAIVAPRGKFDVPPGIAFPSLGLFGGTITLNIDAEFDFYNRLGQGEILVVQWNLNIEEQNSGQNDDATVQITFTGANDLPTAVNDVRTISDNTLGFDDGTVLADDFDIDINDNLTITNAVLSGAVAPKAGTVFPVEYVAAAAGLVGHDANSIQFGFNPYFQFLAAGEKAVFKIKYTITDGIAFSNAS